MGVFVCVLKQLLEQAKIISFGEFLLLASCALNNCFSMRKDEELVGSIFFVGRNAGEIVQQDSCEENEARPVQGGIVCE